MAFSRQELLGKRMEKINKWLAKSGKKPEKNSWVLDGKKRKKPGKNRFWTGFFPSKTWTLTLTATKVPAQTRRDGWTVTHLNRIWAQYSRVHESHSLTAQPFRYQAEGMVACQQGGVSSKTINDRPQQHPRTNVLPNWKWNTLVGHGNILG